MHAPLSQTQTLQLRRHCCILLSVFNEIWKGIVLVYKLNLKLLKFWKHLILFTFRTLNLYLGTKNAMSKTFKIWINSKLNCHKEILVDIKRLVRFIKILSWLIFLLQGTDISPLIIYYKPFITEISTEFINYESRRFRDRIIKSYFKKKKKHVFLKIFIY